MAEMSPSGVSSVRVDRVVAVAATLHHGPEQFGSGYLIGGRLVLTAEHCTRDKQADVPAARLRVIRASDGAVAEVAGVMSDRGLDVAVLRLADDAPWDPDLPSLRFARVDQRQSGVLDDCTGIGFPMFQRDPDRGTRHTSEIHGTIYQTDEGETGHLLMREPLIHPGPVATPARETQSGSKAERRSSWGGLSGTLLFHRDSAIGVVVEHHPRQGDSALRAIGFAQIATASIEIRQCLGVPEADSLPWVSEQSVARVLPAGRPLAEMTDPFALEIHRPVEPEDPHPGLPELPPYVTRDHDTELASAVRAAADGRGGIAVLVGGSSTGKTRACWEALQQLRDRPQAWRLWHPIEPTPPEAALRELQAVEPRTVVWLNDAQHYLAVADGGRGERVAAGLRDLLRDAARAPVLVLATLWPQLWDDLTADEKLHAQAQKLLTGHDITVPAAFTAAELQSLDLAGDVRLAQAAAGAQDGQVIQFLAGAPELLARYRNAPPAPAALIDTAMDARRLGTGVALPQGFLHAAAPGYLTDTEWDALPDDWLEQALDHTAKPARGVRGPLSRIRLRPARSGATGSGPRVDGAQSAGAPDGPLYRLADYLDQHGRIHRYGEIPPPDFWAAAADHASPGDQATLGDAADARGLYRAAAQLNKNAAARGNMAGVFYLADPPPYLLGDDRAAGWVAAHVPLDDPDAVARLMNILRDADAQERVTELLQRDPAGHVSLENPHGLASLLDELREAGAPEQLTELADRAAAHASLDDPAAVARLLGSLLEAGAREQVTVMLQRDPAAQVSLQDTFGVSRLRDALHAAGAPEQVTALADRAAPHAPIDDPPPRVPPGDASLRALGAPGVARLLASLREAGDEQVNALASDTSLEDPMGVALLLNGLREAGLPEQVAVLLRRDPAAHASLEDGNAVAILLIGLKRAGAHDQLSALADRAAAQFRVATPYVADLAVDVLHVLGTPEQVIALADRAARQVSLENPEGVSILLSRLSMVGVDEQITVLADRVVAQASVEDAGNAARLLDALRAYGAPEQAIALADRVVAQASVEDAGKAALLLDALRACGAPEQAIALATRAAAQASVVDAEGVARLLRSLLWADASEQISVLLSRDPAGHAFLAADGAADLLDRLQEVGADQQITKLADRLPGAGMFELVRERDPQNHFRFGREADGSPAKPWDWGDLD
jgi:Trypsin-like peptidase domain